MDMSTDYSSPSTNGEKSNKTSRKFAIIAGILAFGIIGTLLAGSNGQILNALAQTTANDQGTWSNVTKSPTVSTTGTATTKVTPDKFSVTLGVETNGTTAQEAASSNADLMASLIAALKQLGISEEEIGTANYNLYPVYGDRQPTDPCIMIYPPPPECQAKQDIVGYRASNSVTVTLDVSGDLDAGEVIDAGISAGANTVNGVFFFVSNERQEEIRDSLIEDAVASGRHRADVAAEAVGMKVSGVHSISVNEVYFPIFSRGFDAAAQESAVTPILPGEQEVTTTVSTVFFMSSNSTGSSG